VSAATRTLRLTEDLVRRYSRRGNFHSEHATAELLGLPGLVAQGTQVTGPAYGLLLDAWGEDFLAGGEIDVRFVGMTLAGETVTATVDAGRSVADVASGAGAGQRTATAATVEAAASATIGVVNDDRGDLVVVGDAKRGRPAQLP
jgi:acyl dehydratase